MEIVHGGVGQRPVRTGHLARTRVDGQPVEMEDPETTQLVLETLFDMRAVLYEIRTALIEPEDDDEEAEEDA